MPPIRPLPPGLVNKIAAGEVIERPASVVKELMENALDAGAGRVDVTVERGGLELVRVADDGCGIEPEELPLAVAAHATSKLAVEDDLFHIATLGFRGEALASIGQISRLVLRSRVSNRPEGAQITVHGGQAGQVVPCGCAPGTVAEVSQLFFNTPVRRKFLRSPQTELGHVSEAFLRVALPALQVHFTLHHHERCVCELPAGESWPQRIGRLFGRELAAGLIAVESSDGPVRLAGYVAHPALSRSTTRMQYLFLNGRAIRDRSLQHALSEAYRGLLTAGRHPIAFLSLEMPPELVDVNVHPTKLEVRFQDAGRLYSQLLSTIRRKFLATDLTTRVHPAACPTEHCAGMAAGVAGPDQPATADEHLGLPDAAAADRLREQLASWAEEQANCDLPAPGPGGAAAIGAGGGHPGQWAGQLQLTRIQRPSEPAPLPPRSIGPASAERSAAAGLLPAHHRPPSAAPRHAAPAVQIHNRYLVTESEDGVVIIDQHALHERILYEQLRQRIAGGTLEAQNLLVPEPVDLGPVERAAVMEHRELLARLGLCVEPFGGDTVLITGFPAMLANLNPADLLSGIIERLLEGRQLPDSAELLDELLHTIACKAAIKAGDRLSEEEIASLLAEREVIEDAHHCPHGRPAALVFTRAELDRRFKRT